MLANILSRAELKALAEEQNGVHVSIFMPTHRVGRETQQGPIRLKNMLAQAEQQLVARGVRAPEAQKMLEPATNLLDDSIFWQYQSGGLALFAAPALFRQYRLPFDFEPKLVVSERFHVKPLLPLLSGDGQYYILAISQDTIRLLEGTRYSVSEVDLGALPTGLADALKYDDPERRLQFHTTTRTPGGKGERPATFYGHGVGEGDFDKTNILRYFHKVDAGLQELFQNEQMPLVLVGVDYLLPIYQEANSYSYLIEEGVAGNPDDWSAQELHEKTWQIIQPKFAAAQEEAMTRYNNLANTDKASSDLEEIVPAAKYQRVDTLFVAVDRERWGTFDSEANEVQLHEEYQPGDGDLLDFAAVETLLNGGTVYAVKAENVPNASPIAAIFRF